MSEKKATPIPMGFTYLMSSLQIGVVERSQDTSPGKQMGNAGRSGKRVSFNVGSRKKMSISFCNEIWFFSPINVSFFFFLMAQMFKGSLDIHSL